jgi:hypothetical protein
LFNKLFNNENSTYKIKFNNQTNNTFYYLDILNAFIFKYNNEPIWIDCNTKVTLSQHINNKDKNLRVNILDYYNNYLHLINIDINQINLEIVNDIISKSNIDIKKDNKLIYFKILINQIVKMERAVKLDILNLDKKLIQN